MQLILGFIIIFILSVLFSYFQGFIDFLINLGIFPDKYKNSVNFDIMTIFVLYIVFMITAILIAGIVILFSGYLNMKLNLKIKKAKKKSIKKFGTVRPFFYLLDPNIQGLNFEKTHYVYEVYRDYLLVTHQDWIKVDEITASLSNIDQLKLYHEAIEYFNLPDIPKEYGIFCNYSVEELAHYQK